jgi:hypothetical protein
VWSHSYAKKESDLQSIGYVSPILLAVKDAVMAFRLCDFIG